MTSRLLLAATFTATCALAGCSPADPPPTSYADLVAGLETCPEGDLAWYDVVHAAADEDRLEDLLERSRELAATCAGMWEPVWTGGECLYRLRPLESGEEFAAALERARAWEDPVGIARTSNRLGLLDYRAGDLADGEIRFETSLAAAERAERTDLIAFVQNNYAGLLVEMGRFADARTRLEGAVASLEAIGLDGAARAARFNRGVIYLELGDAVAAREILESVQREAVEVGDEETVHDAALNLGNLHLAVGDLAAAEESFREAIGGAPDVEALAYLGLGRLSMARGEYEEAVERLSRAAELAREQERLFALITETLLSDAEIRAGRPEQAVMRLERVIAESDDQDAEESAWVARRVLGVQRLAEGDTEAAIELLEQAVTIVEGQRNQLDPLGSGMYFLRERADVYADLAVAIARSSRGAEAAERILEIARKAQARTLQHLAGGSGAIDASDLDRFGGVLDIRRGLRSGELLLDYLIGEDHGVVLAISSGEASVIPIAGRRDLADDLETFRRHAEEPGETFDPGESGDRLTQGLLVTVFSADELPRRIYIVPAPELALLPFAALPLPVAGTPDFVGDRVELAMMPMAAAPPRWDVGERDVRAPVLLAGAPRLEGEDFPALPWSAYELSELRRVWGERDSTLLQGEGLNREELLSALSSGPPAFRTIHLATHAVASTRDPRRCGVVLSDAEKLTLDEIVGGGVELSDNALVVLAACRTGLGELVPGEGVIGLGWSFMRAGARGVVVSHWTVPDDATAKLMARFHGGLREGADPVLALAEASRELQEINPAYRHPAYWAPFVIQLRP